MTSATLPDKLALPTIDDIDKELAERSLSEFVQQAWHIVEPGTTYQHNFHIDAICEHLEAVHRREIRRLCINIPPRFMKSLLVSVLYPVWTWINNPYHKFLSASYGESLSVRDALKSRRIIQSAWFQVRWGDRFQLTGDQNQKTRYDNNKTGYRIATSVDGLGTGEGGDDILIDDPHNIKDTNSEVKLVKTITWHDETMQTRLNDPKTGAFIYIMQRSNEQDISGHILSKNLELTHLCLPMRYEGERSKTTVIMPETGLPFKDPRSIEGELLWPERFPEKEVTDLEKAMGSYAAAGQLQQRPSPREGGFLKRRWFELVRKEPEEVVARVRFWDQAATAAIKKKVNPDWTAGARMSLTKDGIIYLEHVARLQESPHKVEKETKYWATMDGPGCQIYIEQEPGASGKNNISFYTRYVLQDFTVRGMRPTGPKESYVDAFAAYAEAGNVKVVIGEWNEPFFSQSEMFPMAEKDDIIDAVAKAFHCIMINRRGAGARVVDI